MRVTSDLVTLRCSALPLAFRCPASIRPSTLPLNESNDAAVLGTAVHEALRSVVETGSLDWAAVPDIAQRHGVAEDDVRALAAMGAKLWPQIAASFEGALSEVEVSAEVAPGVWLTGHLDGIARRLRVARGLDWKTGRRDRDYAHQMKGYASLLLLEDPELEEVTLTVVWLRTGEVESYTCRRPDADAWVAELVRAVIQWDGVYHPHDECPHCPRSHECAASNALARRDIAAIADKVIVARVESELSLMSPAEIVEVVKKAAMVQGYAERVRQAVRAHVMKHGDVVADGIRLTIDTEERRDIDTLKAWPVLEAAGFDDQDFAESLTVRISRAEKVVAKKAGRGKGATAVRELKAALEKAGAIEIKEIHKLTEKRA